MEFRFERFTDERLHDFQELFRKVFNRTLSIQYIQKKYDNSLHNGKYLGFLAYTSGDLPVGFFGVTFYQLEYRGKCHTAAQCGDVMTDPEYQGKGLFTELGRMTQDLARQENLSLIYAFPNQNSFPGFIGKLGWRVTGNMRCYIVPVKALPFESVLRKLGFAGIYRKFAERTIRPLLSTDRVLASTFIDEEHGGVRHDQRFFNYKSYTDNYALSLHDCKVWIKVNGAIHVGDMEDVEDEKRVKVMVALKRLARRLGVNRIIFQTSAETHLDRYLSRYYTGTDSFPIIFYDIASPVSLEKLQFTYGDLDSF